MLRREFMVSGGAAALTIAAQPVLAKGASRQGDAALGATLDAVFADGIVHSPEYATSLGLDKGRNAGLRSRLSPVTAAERRADLGRNRNWIGKITALAPAKLSDTGKRNRLLALNMLDQRTQAAASFDLDSVQRPYRLFQQGGAYFELPDFLNSQHPIETASDCEAYLSRLAGFAGMLDQDTAEQRIQSARGFTAPGWSIDLTLGQLRKLRSPAADASGMVGSLVSRAKAKGIAGDWQRRAARIVGSAIYPALDRQIVALTVLLRTTRVRTH